jgi:hypothetical protein
MNLPLKKSILFTLTMSLTKLLKTNGKKNLKNSKKILLQGNGETLSLVNHQMVLILQRNLILKTNYKDVKPEKSYLIEKLK